MQNGDKLRIEYVSSEPAMYNDTHISAIYISMKTQPFIHYSYSVRPAVIAYRAMVQC